MPDPLTAIRDLLSDNGLGSRLTATRSSTIRLCAASRARRSALAAALAARYRSL